MLSGIKGRLFLQAGFTAVFALLGASASSGWTVPTLLVAAGLVFVGLAMRPEEQWRWIVTGAVGFSVAYGLLAFVSGHYVPGTIVGVYTLVTLLNGSAASAFAGLPSQPPIPAPPIPAPPITAPPVPGHGTPVYGAPAAAPVVAAYPPPPPPAYVPPAAPPVEAVPGQPAQPVDVVPAQPVGYAPPPPALVAPEAPALPASRPAAMTILPGK